MGQRTAASFQLVLIEDAKTYSFALLGEAGDLVQVYTGSANSPTIAADTKWSGADAVAEKYRTLYCAVHSSDGATPSLIGAQWNINDVPLVFNNTNNICSSPSQWAGLCKQVAENVGTTADPIFVQKLVFLGDVVTAAGGENFNVGVKVEAEAGSSTVFLFGSKPVRVVNMRAGQPHAEIYAKIGSFVLDNDTSQVTASMRCFDPTDITKTVTISSWKWALLDGGVFDWANPISTSQDCVVSGSQIDSYGELGCQAIAADGTVYTDIQTITDISDPYVIFPNCTPADMHLYRSGGAQQVTFDFKVKTSDGSKDVTSNFTFAYTLLTPAGMPIRTGTGAQCVITLADCLDGVAPLLHVEATSV